MIKGSIHKRDIININIYAPLTRDKIHEAKIDRTEESK